MTTRSTSSCSATCEAHAEKERIFADLYTTYSTRISKRVAGMISDPDAVEDVVQEVFLKLWLLLDTSEAEQTFSSGYIYRVTTNKAIDYLRSKKRRARGVCEFDEAFYEEHATPVQETSEMVESLEIARRALTHLKPEDASLLIASAYGFTIQEMSTRQTKSPNYLKTRMSRARQSLRQYLLEEAS